MELNLIFTDFQNIIERFPATLIQEPTAFTSNDPIEMYNNILVFIVGGEASARSEMHIFQVSLSILDLVDNFLKFSTILVPKHLSNSSRRRPQGVKKRQTHHKIPRSTTIIQ